MSRRGVIIGHLSDTPLKRMLWVIVKPIWFQRPNGQVIEMSPHLILNYTSSPWFLWPIIPVRDAEYDVASAFHDLCVRNRKLLGMTLMDCHAVFREVLESQRVAPWKSKAMYYAVVAFNWIDAGKGDGSLPRYIRLSNRDLKLYEDIKAAFPWNEGSPIYV